MSTEPLSQLVADYENYYTTVFDNELYHYNSTESFDELIKMAIYNDYRAKHSLGKSKEYSIDNNSLSDMNNYCKISNVRNNLLKCTKFEDLLKVMCYPEQIGLIPGFNPIDVYDSCLRFGVNTCATLNPDSESKRDIILPDYIYIHNKSQNGAQKLFQNLNTPYTPRYHSWDNKKEFPYLELSDFPSLLNKFLPHHIENFLFIYEDKL